MKLRISAICATLALFLVIAAAEETNEAEQPSDETVPPLGPITEPPIKLVHVLNPGEREYLSPNLIGLQNIAMTFLPLTMNFLNIIDAFREVVNGVRYEIIVNAIDTKENNTDVVCRLVILEKPWLRTEWGDKVRELVNSNCTSDADNLTDPAARADTLNDKYPRNAVFNGGSRNELNDEDMAKLESQIFGSGTKKVQVDLSKEATLTSASPSYSTSTTKATTTSTSSSSSTTTTMERIEVEGENEEANAENNEDEATTLPAELNDTEKKWLDDIFSVGAVNFENTRCEHHNEATINEPIVVESGTANTNDAASSVQSAQYEAIPEADVQQQQRIEELDYYDDNTQQQQQKEETDFQQTVQVKTPIQEDIAL